MNSSLTERIVGVFRLDVPIFEEIEHDTTATGQAAGVVAVVAVLSAIGSSLTSGMTGSGMGTNVFVPLISAFAGWLIWSALTYWVGTTIFDGKADLGEMLRVIGFAYAPQALAIIPCLGAVVGGIWSLIAGFVAIRQGLDLDNMKAFLTIIVGFVAYVALTIVLDIFAGGMSAGL